MINGLTSRVDMRSRQGERPRPEQGLHQRRLDPGQRQPRSRSCSRARPGSINGGVLNYAIRSNDSFYGTENEGLQVILFQDNVVIDLANVNGQIFFR